MTKNLWRAAATITVAATLSMSLTACGDWLGASDANNNPNQPTAATINQLFVGTQTNLTIQYTSDLARTACLWVQQCAGTDRQYKDLGVYSYGEDAYNGPFEDTYTGGGLIDLRKVEALAADANDQVYGGIARVEEAMLVGLAADVWGDIPYSEAVGSVVKPKLDPQQDVYAAVQAKLDTAITLLAGSGSGPGAQDLYYGGDKAKWTRLAHTLKARFYLHVAEKLGAASYASALAQAQQGLQQGDDFLGISGANPQSNNTWYQFIVIQRAGYLMAGKALVDLMQQHNDPRLAQYFSPAGNGQIGGADPGTQGNPQTISDLNQDTRVTAAFKQPIVTYAENQLIIAETAFRTGNTGLALQAYNAERTSQGAPTATSVTLNDILTEKYVALFQNIEAWNDWKRTCFPALTPAGGNVAIPGRIIYPAAETNTNPNFPSVGAQPARNWNDPNAC